MRAELLLPGAAEPAETAAPGRIDEAGAESRVIDDRFVARDERQLDPFPPRLDVQVAVTDTAGENRQNDRPRLRVGRGPLPNHERLAEAFEHGREHLARVLPAGGRGFDAVLTGDEAGMSEEQLGEGTGRQGPWQEEDEDARAAKQQGDPHALDVEGDPRGGVQSEEYRFADPRDVVQEGDVMMSGPAGAPQDGSTVEERRAESAETRERAVDDPAAGT